MVTNIPSQPDTYNFLKPTGFRLIINQMPNINYFCRRASLPGVTINTIDTATTFATIKYPGDKTQYEDLSITFGVDENLTNMREIFDWMIGATHPRDYDQYKDLVEKEPFYSLDKGMGGVLRDVTVMVLSNQDRPIMEYQFKDAFPINLTPLDMDATPAEIDYLEAQATFSYTSYTMESLI